MKLKQSYAEYLKDWRHLLGQLAANTALAGTNAATQRQASLAALLAKIEDLMQQQSDRNAAKQAASKEIQLLFFQGRELARDIKLELKGNLGARSMDLLRYKVNPMRERNAKKASEAEPQGEADGGQQPGASTPAAGPAANGALSPSKA